MSWSEVKKINGDMKKSLDTLIKEQFNTNFGDSGDINYIKSSQLGTNLNNLLGGSSTSTIDFNNKPLVDKINYLLLSTGNASLCTGTNVLASKTSTVSVDGTSSKASATILTYTPKFNGQVKIEASMWASTVTPGTKMGIFVNNNTSVDMDNDTLLLSGPSQNSSVVRTATLNVVKDKILKFYIGYKDGSEYTKPKCYYFKILGDIAFKNLY